MGDAHPLPWTLPVRLTGQCPQPGVRSALHGGITVSRDTLQGLLHPLCVLARAQLPEDDKGSLQTMLR